MGQKISRDAGSEVRDPNCDAQPLGEAMKTSDGKNRWNIGCYNLFDEPIKYPGKYIIFNHFKFVTDLKLSERIGTDHDVARLKKTFKSLGFQKASKCQRDLKFEDIINKINEVLQQDFKEFGSIVVVILTHGDSKQLYAHDKLYDVDEIKKLFAEREIAKKLAKKPKTFLIQACQGNKEDYGVKVSSEDDAVGSGYHSLETREDTVITIPIMADFLLAFGSASGYVSYRNEDEGSWFIQVLCDAIYEFNKTKDFETILTLVKHDIAYNKYAYNRENNETPIAKQIPEVTSTLTKKLYLHKEAQMAATNSPSPGQSTVA